jgi:hypothetical protein
MAGDFIGVGHWAVGYSDFNKLMDFTKKKVATK